MIFCIKSWFFTQNTPNFLWNFFNIPPITWNPGSTTGINNPQSPTRPPPPRTPLSRNLQTALISLFVQIWTNKICPYTSLRVLGPTQAFHDKICTVPDMLYYHNKIYSAVETTTKITQKAKNKMISRSDLRRDIYLLSCRLQNTN